MSLTGNRDIDIIVLMNLDDKELGIVCQVNKKVNSICNSSDFWIRRIEEKLEVYPEIISKLKDFLEFDTYKELYFYLSNIHSDIRGYITGLFSDGDLDPKFLEKLENFQFPEHINKKLFVKNLKRKIFEKLYNEANGILEFSEYDISRTYIEEIKETFIKLFDID